MHLSYQEKLLQEFNKRRAKNSSYSLRAFATFLGVSVTALSQVLARKRHLSKKNAARIADRLQLTPYESAAMLNEINKRDEGSYANIERLLLEEDQFRLISDWYHFALLSLARLPGISSDAATLAARLGVPATQITEALGRLQRLQLIDAANGQLRRTALPINTPKDMPSASLRRHNRQMLELAASSLDRTPVELRDIGSMTLAINTSKIPEAKAKIERFKDEMELLLEESTPNSVYNLGIQLFPLTEVDGHV